MPLLRCQRGPGQYGPQASSSNTSRATSLSIWVSHLSATAASVLWDEGVWSPVNTGWLRLLRARGFDLGLLNQTASVLPSGPLPHSWMTEKWQERWGGRRAAYIGEMVLRLWILTERRESRSPRMEGMHRGPPLTGREGQTPAQKVNLITPPPCSDSGASSLPLGQSQTSWYELNALSWICNRPSLCLCHPVFCTPL